MSILETILSDLPARWWVTDVYVGENWVLSRVRHLDGRVRAGIAATPHPLAPDAQFQLGHYELDQMAAPVAGWLRSSNPTAAAVGLATLNAMNQPDERLLTTDDAADWLAAQACGHSIAIFGRFPFIEQEVRPHARQTWVFEQHPRANELGSNEIASVVPQADIVAITASSLVNHTIETILPHIRTGSVVVMLGPSTPLCPKLLDAGFDALFGVSVVEERSLIETVTAGSSFQKVEGLRRVALFRQA